MCPRSYHVKCVGLTKVPDGEFICPRHADGGETEEGGSGTEDDDSVFEITEDSSGSSSSSNSDFSSDEDLGALVERHRKVPFAPFFIFFLKGFCVVNVLRLTEKLAEDDARTLR